VLAIYESQYTPTILVVNVVLHLLGHARVRYACSRYHAKISYKWPHSTLI